jgi:single-stranded-DNA-specific exonuclease
MAAAIHRFEEPAGAGAPAGPGPDAETQRESPPARAAVSSEGEDEGPLSVTGRRWRWPELQLTGCGETGHAELLEALMTQRKVGHGPARAAYLAPALSHLLDPHAMADMPQAIARLCLARERGERVVVWGDYDVDGVCASAIVVSFLRELGLTCSYYIPDRRTEGYGLNTAAMAGLAAEYDLLVTVDCGSTSVDEIAHARALGLEAVVVDHHQVGDVLPAAVACLNPHRADCTFADKDLCAAGLAFMLCVALRRALRCAGAFAGPEPEPDVRPLLDMVAVATVADMVPLTGLNRVLVHAGLTRLRTQARPGLQALCQVARVQPALVQAQDLGFRLGPRINARGRMEHAGMAVDLMLAETVEAAMPMAQALDAANEERRAIERQTVRAACSKIEAEGHLGGAALVVHDASWHPGVLGLVASRLVARYHRPAVVIGEGGRGSARSIKGINLHACLSAVHDTMLRFGGHPAAAGLTILPENVDALRQRLAGEVQALVGAPPYAPLLTPDLEICGEAMTHALCTQLGRLAPFGQANPEPLLAARGQRVHACREVGDGHLKLELGPGRIDAIAFGMASCIPQLGAFVDVLYFLERNVYQGRTRLQMRVHDLRPAAPPP